MKKAKVFFSVFMLSSFVGNVYAALPTVTTLTPYDITVGGAWSGGNVSSDGGAAITSRGVCWSTSSGPTVALSTKTVNGNTQGIFNSQITGLIPNTLYYLRAYATNSQGSTGYGTAIRFRTPPAVTIGTQVWAQKNLDVRRYRNGDAIPQVRDSAQWANLTTGAWCWYNNDSATYAATYGRLYNWYSVNDSRNLCPAGWHVPTVAELKTLTTYLGGDALAGGKMKSTTLWQSPNTGATNSSGFSGLPAGGRSRVDGFGVVRVNGFFWSSTDGTTALAGTWGLFNGSSSVSRNLTDKQVGYSVRCLRD